MKKITAALVAFLAASALSAQAMTNDTDQRFVIAAYRANLLQIREAREVERNTAYPGLRDYAQRAIDDASVANVKLRSTSHVAGVSFPDLADVDETISVMTSTASDGTAQTVTTTTVTSENPYGSGSPTAIAWRTSLAACGWQPIGADTGPSLARQYWQNAAIERYHMLTLLNDEMQNGADPALRALASQLSDVTQHELAIAQQHLDGTWVPGTV
jgi:predicted outer membrane protein